MSNDILIKKRSTLKGLFWSFGDTIFNQISSVFLIFILARLLSPQDFGIFGIAYSYLLIAQSFIEGGLTNSLIRESNTNNKDYSTVFYLVFLLSLIVYFSIFFTASYFGEFYDNKNLVLMIKVLSLVLLINPFSYINKIILVKNIDFKKISFINFLASIFSSIIAVAMILNGFQFWSLASQAISKTLFQAIFFNLFANWKPIGYFKIEIVVKYLNFGWKLLVVRLIDSLFSNFSNLFIGKLYSINEIGLYANANKLSFFAPQLLDTAIVNVSFPTLSRDKNDTNILNSKYRRFLGFYIYLSFPLIIGSIVIAPEVIQVLLGSEWKDTIIIFRLISLTYLFYPFHSLNLNILQVTGHSNYLLKLTIVKRLISFFVIVITIYLKLNLILFLWLGVFESLIDLIINSYYSGKLLKLPLLKQLMSVNMIFISAILMGIFVLIFRNLYIANTIINLVTLVLFGIFSYIVLSIVFKIYEFQVLSKIVIVKILSIVRND